MTITVQVSHMRHRHDISSATVTLHTIDKTWLLTSANPHLLPEDPGELLHWCIASAEYQLGVEDLKEFIDTLEFYQKEDLTFTIESKWYTLKELNNGFVEAKMLKLRESVNSHFVA